MVDMGWKLVPVDPRKEQLAAMDEAYMPFGEMLAAYDAMLQSSPTPTGEEVDAMCRAMWGEAQGVTSEERRVISAACRFVDADIYVHPTLSRADAVKAAASELDAAVSAYTGAQPPKDARK